jgi:RNA polymerase sigma-70 factor (ECF subfamily)
MTARRKERETGVLFGAPIEPSAEQQEDEDTARIVAAVQGGDKAAFAGIYERYFDRIYGYMRLALRDAHEAEDATQQVFVKALEGIGAYRRRGQPFRAWLFTIARNHAVSMLRKLNRLEVEDPAELDRRRERRAELGQDGWALEWITDGDLLVFIERLPLAQRQVLAMRFMFDMRVKEIAKALGRTPNDVSKLQHRALAFLNQRLSAIGRDRGNERPLAARHRPKQAEVLRERRFSLFK